jgi:fructose-bisphosphate aldolase class II
MLTTLVSILERAESGGYAVIAPDFSSILTARTMLKIAEDQQAPLILSYSTHFKPICDVSSYSRFIEIVRNEIEHVNIPVALHLDHATTIEEIKEAVDTGFTSVMMDASFESNDKNRIMTQQTVAIAHPKGVSVEAELGHVATGQDYVASDSVAGFLTDPKAAVQFVADTGIDALAVAIGTVHGPYKGEPNLDFDLLAELKRLVPVPLVLHGSSGLGEDNIKRSIDLGIRKINVYSDLMTHMQLAMRDELKRQHTDPLAVVQAQIDAIRAILSEYISFSGSAGKASR